MADGQYSAADVQPGQTGQYSMDDVQAVHVDPQSFLQMVKAYAAHPIDQLKHDWEAYGQQGQQLQQKMQAGQPILTPESVKPYIQAAEMAGTPAAAEGAVAALPEAEGAVKNFAGKLYQSALKPSTTLGAQKTAQLVQTGLENELPVSKVGVEKLGALIDDVNQKIADQIASNPNAPINKFKVASRLGDTAQKFANQVSPGADLQAISDVGNDFLATQPSNIAASDAQALKQGTYQQLKAKSYGELKSASIEAQKALARGLKEELVQQFPELANLNAQDSNFLQLDPVLEKAVNRISNHQLIGLGTPMAGAAGKAITGSNAGAAVAGAVKAIVDNPAVKSRLAIALNKSGVPLSQAAARIAAYSATLGAAAANSKGSNPQTDQSQQ